MNLFQVTKKQPSGLELKTFTGNPVTFTPTYSEALPAPFNGINLKAEIVASGGNGTPSTPIPIVGHSELNLVRCGKNLIDDSKKVYASNNIALGTETYLGKSCYLPAGTYTISVTTLDGNNTNLYCQDLDDNVRVFSAYDVFSYTFTLSKGTNVSFWAYKATYTSADDITSAQVELGSQATAYAPYNGTPYLVQFGQTVYGGVLDVKNGKLNVTHGYIELNSLDWDLHTSFPNTFYTNGFETIKLGTSDFLCTCYVNGGTFFNYALLEDGKMYSSTSLSRIALKDTRYSTEAEFVSAMAGKYLAYELATPIEIDVSSISVEAVSGVNNIVSDCGGDITVQCLI